MPTLEQSVAELAEVTADELERRATKLLTLARELRGESAQLTGRELSRELATMTEPEEREEREEKAAPPPRSVGRFGLITIEGARVKAQELGEFTQAEFAAKLGLKPPEHQPWIARLIADKSIRYVSGRFRCVKPMSLRDWVVRQEEAFAPEDAAKACQMNPQDAMAGLENLEARKIIREVEDSGLFAYVPPDPREGPREHVTGLPPEKEPPNYADAPVRGMPVRRAASEKASRRQRSTPGQRHKITQRDNRYKAQEEAKKKRAEAQRAKAQKDPKWQSRNGKRAA